MKEEEKWTSICCHIFPCFICCFEFIPKMPSNYMEVAYACTCPTHPLNMEKGDFSFEHINRYCQQCVHRYSQDINLEIVLTYFLTSKELLHIGILSAVCSHLKQQGNVGIFLKGGLRFCRRKNSHICLSLF